MCHVTLYTVFACGYGWFDTLSPPLFTLGLCIKDFKSKTLPTVCLIAPLFVLVWILSNIKLYVKPHTQILAVSIMEGQRGQLRRLVVTTLYFIHILNVTYKLQYRLTLHEQISYIEVNPETVVLSRQKISLPLEVQIILGEPQYNASDSALKCRNFLAPLGRACAVYCVGACACDTTGLSLDVDHALE